MSSNALKIIPMGGFGEVGKNMLIYEYGKNIMIVETGIMFPENDMLGIDYIIPDFEYVKKNKDIVRGIVITHGHEDHVGAISHIVDEPPAASSKSSCPKPNCLTRRISALSTLVTPSTLAPSRWTSSTSATPFPTQWGWAYTRRKG